MSESAGKIFRGLQEAYASIYANKSENLTEETIVSEVQEEQEFEISEEAFCGLLIDYLVIEGYVKTEKQALNMIPHISEEWMNSIVSHIYISECFHSCVDSLIEEGYDLSSYTEQELYEVYIQESVQDLHEALPLALPLLANPGTLAAGAGLVAGTVYAGKKAWDAWRQRRSGWNQSAMDNIQWRDSSKPKPKPVAAKPKPTTVLRSQGDLNLDRPGGSSVYPGTGYERGNVNLGSTASTGGPSPEPPKKDDKKPEEPKTEKPKSNFKGELRPKARARMDQKLRQQTRSQATERIFKALERFNQSPVKKGADLATTMGRLKTGAAALKNVLIGKTGAGAITRGISLAAPGVADEIRTGGVIRTGVTQGLQTSLQKSRTEGEKEKERIKRREEQKRDDYARSQQQTGGGWSSVPSNR